MHSIDKFWQKKKSPEHINMGASFEDLIKNNLLVKIDF
jgi:hypothetical protein